MVNDPTRDDERLPQEQPEAFEGDPPEDAVITKSMEALPSMAPPTNFVAEVMYQVRETHLRNRLAFSRVLTYVGVIAALVAVFFLWDVRDYAQENQVESFGQAFSQKADSIINRFDGLFDAAAGVLSASWQLLKGFLGAFFSATPLPLQILIIAAVLALLWLVRKWLF